MRSIIKRSGLAVTLCPRTTALFAAAFCAAVAPPALAHHSRANFDLERVIELEGVVSEYTWRNPHAFAVIEATDASGATEEWTFEMNSTTVLTRFGTSEESLAVGDHVVVRGNPDRDPNRRFVYANVFVKDDGTEVWSSFPPAPAAGVPGAPVASPETAGSTDFTGVWIRAFPPDFDLLKDPFPTGFVGELPVNAKGQTQLDAYDPDENPSFDCQPRGIPPILGAPYPFEIRQEDTGTLRIVYEVNHVERLIHLDATEHPADVAPSPLGHSIGGLDEDGALVVETARFSDVRWGLTDGVDSSTSKTTREVYRLAEDGRTLELTVTLEDPEYLRAPATIQYRYGFAPAFGILDFPACDPAAARRHLTAGQEGGEPVD